MDSNGTEFEDKGAIGISPAGFFKRQVDVFYYSDLAVDETENCRLFTVGGDLTSAFADISASSSACSPMKKRVKDVHKGVIDLPIADKFDCSGFHVGQGTAVIESF